MILKSRINRTRYFLNACFVIAIALSHSVRAQDAAQTPAAPTLIQQMAGTWQVQQRMWQGFAAEAIVLEPAVARRNVMAGGFLEEVMTSANKDGKDSFVRVAYVNYNAVSKQFEYCSLDSRAPQMMNERSTPTAERITAQEVSLQGGSFVAPQWGATKNVSFAYRLTVGAVENGKQIVRLHFKPQTGENLREFVAFEYVYTQVH
jgi:hypothetical protein